MRLFMSEKALKLSKINFGIAVGATWALFTIFGAWVAIFGWSHTFVEVMSSTYPGYSATFLGGIIGAIWGFIHGFIKGFLVAYIYNYCCAKR